MLILILFLTFSLELTGSLFFPNQRANCKGQITNRIYYNYKTNGNTMIRKRGEPVQVNVGRLDKATETNLFRNQQ